MTSGRTAKVFCGRIIATVRVTDNKCLERVQGEIGIPGKKPLQIWDVCGTLRIDNKELKEGNLEVQGVIPVKIVYRRDDSSMPVNMAEGVIPFRYTIEGGELKEGCLMNLQGRIEQISASLAGDEKVLVKAVVGLELIAFWPSTEPIPLCNHYISRTRILFPR